MNNLALNNSNFARHLIQRGLKPWHRVWIDWEQEVVTFPIYSFCDFWPYSKLVGYQRYNWREVKIRDNGGKYFTWLSDNYKDRACYGLGNCFGHGPLLIVEGVWDSLRVGNCYFDVIATLTCSPSRNLKAHLRQLAQNRPIIAICDNDEAGLRLRSSADYYRVVPEPYKDVNDMPHDICFQWLNLVLAMV